MAEQDLNNTQQEQSPVTPSPDEAQNTETSKSIPYDRFKQVNDQRKALQDKLDALEKAEQERAQAKLAEEGKYQELIDSLRPEADRAKALAEQLKAYQDRDAVELEAELNALDETMKTLVPEGDPSKQLAWVRSAKRAGLFNKSTPPVTESGVTGDRKATDEKLTTEQQRIKDMAKSMGHLRTRNNS